MNKKLMTDSLTPWDSEPDVLESKNTKPPRKLNTSSQLRINRYNSQGSRIRAATSQANRLKPQKQVIKLQQRVPTQSNNVLDWQVELKQYKNELIFKIPPTFLTIPPKKSNSSAKIKSERNFYKRQDQIGRQKVSFLNFKKEIEQLDRLKATKKIFSDNQPHPKLKNIMKVSEVKKSSQILCTTKNICLFEDSSRQLGTRQASRVKLAQQSLQKKHILDKLLSKFQ